MENKFLIGNEIIETAIAAFTLDPREDTALAVVRALQQRMQGGRPSADPRVTVRRRSELSAAPVGI